MASITIRRLDDSVKAKLRMRAASHGRSMEEEAREILRAGLRTKPTPELNLAESISRHIYLTGGLWQLIGSVSADGLNQIARTAR